MKKVLFLILSTILSYYIFEPLFVLLVITSSLIIPFTIFKGIYNFGRRPSRNRIKEVKQFNKDLIKNNSDPLSKIVSWEPCSKANYHSVTRSIKTSNQNVLEYGLNLKTRFTFLNIILISILMFYVFIYIGISKDSIWIYSIPILLAVSITIIYQFTKAPIKFNKSNNLFNYKSFNINLNEIHAIQLIGKIIGRGRRKDGFYELNLVLKNKNRINLESHKNVSKIREQAHEISNFLDISVWDK